MEVRPEDIQVAQAEVNGAIAATQRAQAELNLSSIKAPIRGQILKIHTRAGEVVANDGIVELAYTDQMNVIAEIYETDIAKITQGQKATITSAAFPGQIQGIVSQIGLKVNQQSVRSVNPLADTDQKVIEVKIRISDPVNNQLVVGLTNLQVQVFIHI